MGNPIPTIVYTDHRPLIGLLTNKEPQTARHTRWCLTVSTLKIDLRYETDGNHYRKLVTDTKEKLKLIFEAHEIGHEGYYKTYQRLRKSYYWNDMVNDIKRIISKCEKCQLNRSKPYPEPTEDNPTKVERTFHSL
eukprot:jgi/Orpsp1_1/1186218/evm.model.d7180000048967.1